MPQSDVKRVFDAIKAKRKDYQKLFDYYDGDQPVTYSTQALREVFRNLDERFTLNFCAVVIDAVKERISLRGFSSKDKAVSTALSTLITSQDLLNEADEVHEAALVTGEAFVHVWPQTDADGAETGAAEIFYNDPRNVAMFYDPSNPKRASMAGKMWTDDDDYWHMTIYYPDHLEYYITRKASEGGKGEDINEKSFAPDATKRGVIATEKETIWPDNPYAPELPVFHFRVEKRTIKSDIKNVVPLQNGMNKLMADMMITSEFAAWPQRYFITNSDVASLQAKPGTIWGVPPAAQGDQATSGGEFTASPITNYTAGIDKLIAYTSSITNTPHHYFDPSSDAPSGEALIAMEAPLNKKAQDRIDKFTHVWQAIAAFALKIQGMTVAPEVIVADFEEPSTIQPMTSANIIKILTDAGVPLETALSDAGWTDTEVEEMKKVKDAAAAQNQASLANALLAAEKAAKVQNMPAGANPQPAQLQPQNGRPQGAVNNAA